MNHFWSGNECERAHILTTATTGSKNSQKSQQSDKQSEQCSVPPKGPFLKNSWSWMKSSARHTLSNQQAQVKQPENVNLIENAQSDTSKAPCCSFDNIPNTAITIVCTINLSIDCMKNKVSTLPWKKNMLY